MTFPLYFHCPPALTEGHSQRAARRVLIFVIIRERTWATSTHRHGDTNSILERQQNLLRSTKSCPPTINSLVRLPCESHVPLRLCDIVDPLISKHRTTEVSDLGCRYRLSHQVSNINTCSNILYIHVSQFLNFLVEVIG